MTLTRKQAYRRIEISRIVMIVAGIASASFGLESFLIPNDFIDGGVTGISLLISSLTNWPISVLIVIINAPFIWLGYKKVDKLFAIKTLVAIAVLAIILATVHFPLVTKDKLLTAVFGGFFLGSGIGLAMRGGAVIDGTELLAVYINPRLPISIGQIILIINIGIFGVAAFFLGIEASLYSILTYLAATQMINYIVQGIDEFTQVTIISSKSELIKNVIMRHLHRGVTIYKGERGFGKSQIEDKNIDIIVTVITLLEVQRLVARVQQIDPTAFIVTNTVTGVRGGLVKRQALDH
ncbi:YitT family protein [Mucilaginibacter antarcticus]|uniref:YitT family protein n=1 Tax=Mucilaginibacter antarcticus TaxID=1855725 RepID=A0ABW5XMY9_9SPHI